MTERQTWVILDTSVIRGSLRGDPRLGIDLEVLRRSAPGPVALSQVACLELASQLRKGEPDFRLWQRFGPQLAAILDPQIPVVPLGPVLRVMLGRSIDAPAEKIHDEVAALRTIWHVMRNARSPSDLRQRRVRADGVLREYRPAGIEMLRREAGERWNRLFGHVDHANLHASHRPSLQAAFREKLGVEDVAHVPELETAVHFGIERIIQRVRCGYRPKRNDAMDFEQLYVLGLPAYLCSSDFKFVEAVQRLNTPGSERVVKPSELTERLSALPAI